MNVQRHSPSGAEDLDSTAELPVLDIAAMEAAAEKEHLGSTDTWIIPPPTLRANAETLEQPAPVNTDARDVRSELETNLRSLSANLGDVEERLKRKVELLAENELALEAVRQERAAAEARADQLAQDLVHARAAEAVAREASAQTERALQERLEAADAVARSSKADVERSATERDATAEALRVKDQEVSARIAEYEKVIAGFRLELGQVQARATRYFETLQSQEGRRSLFDNILSGLQSDIDQGESRVASLERERSAQSERNRALEAQLNGRSERVSQLDQQVSALTAALAQRGEELNDARNEGAQLRRETTSLNASLAASAERVRTLESTAAGLDATSNARQSELERAAQEREQLRVRVTELEASLATATSLRDEHEKAAAEARTRISELESSAGERQTRAERLDTELAAVRAEMDQWSISLKEAAAERSEHVARAAANEERIRELEARVEEQQDLVRTHQSESNVSIARTKEVEADLRVAEEAIHRLESDLRSKSARVDELEKTNHEWHHMVDEARVALTEREALIQRLEDEASNSSVLLGQIQQSMKRLDPSVSGTHEAMPEGATRLLIRADGDSEVVHVLGRKTSIGRTPDNDLQIDAKFISRHHAVILAGPARTIIEDLNSTNGVLVNSRRVTRQVLEDGDDVVVGRTRFRFAVRPAVDRR